MNADLWAERQLRAVSPWFAWFGSGWTPFAFIAAGAVSSVTVAAALAFFGQAPSAYGAAFLTFLAFSAIAIASHAMPAVVLSPSLGLRSLEVRRELLWVVVGAVLGLVLSEVWTAITTPPAP